MANYLQRVIASGARTSAAQQPPVSVAPPAPHVVVPVAEIPIVEPPAAPLLAKPSHKKRAEAPPPVVKPAPKAEPTIADERHTAAPAPPETQNESIRHVQPESKTEPAAQPAAKTPQPPLRAVLPALTKTYRVKAPQGLVRPASISVRTPEPVVVETRVIEPAPPLADHAPAPAVSPQLVVAPALVTQPVPRAEAVPIQSVRSSQPQSRIRIGRIDVQVNNRPAAAPRRAAAKAAWSPSGLSLERFALKP